MIWRLKGFNPFPTNHAYIINSTFQSVSLAGYFLSQTQHRYRVLRMLAKMSVFDTQNLLYHIHFGKSVAHAFRRFLRQL